MITKFDNFLNEKTNYSDIYDTVKYNGKYKSNYGKLKNCYKTSIIYQLEQHYGYNTKEKINDCPILTYILNNERELNPGREEHVLFNLIDDKNIINLVNRSKKIDKIQHRIKGF